MADSDYWESAYRGGDYRHWEFNYPSPELAAVIATNVIKPRSRIVDIGCGGGLDAIFLAKCGFRVIGIDISGNALRIASKRARRAGVNVSWLRANALHLPMNSSSVDFVNDRGVFHIIEDKDRTKYAAELYRVLKPGGSIVIRGSGDARRFYPVTEEAIDRFFPARRFCRGPVVEMPLLSIVGAMEARMVMLTRRARPGHSTTKHK